jgi:hypothetical protein
MNFIYHLDNLGVQTIKQIGNLIQTSLDAEDSGLSGYDAATICNLFLTLRAKVVASSSKFCAFK